MRDYEQRIDVSEAMIQVAMGLSLDSEEPNILNHLVAKGAAMTKVQVVNG